MHRDDTSRRRLLGIAPEGLVVIVPFAVVSIAVGAAGPMLLGPFGWSLTAIAGVALIWCLWFFRDPTRTAPSDPACIISPADGVICDISPATPPPELELEAAATDGMTRVSVFMNVFNVHVNRAPTAGTVDRVRHTAGRFFNASLDKASEHNERCAMSLRLPDGRTMAVVQIAGLVARRIVCWVPEKAPLRTGERFGLIRFGSRVDVYLPAGIAPAVAVGERVSAGQTVIAKDDAPSPGADA